MHTHTYCTRTRTHACTRTRTHAHAHAHGYAHTHTRTRTDKHTYTTDTFGTNSRTAWEHKSTPAAAAWHGIETYYKRAVNPKYIEQMIDGWSHPFSKTKRKPYMCYENIKHQKKERKSTVKG